MGVMAAVAFTLASCTEEKLSAPEVEMTPYTIYANSAETKTANDGMSTVWAEGDALSVFHAPAGSTEYGDNTKFTLKDAATGKFDTDELKGELSDANDWYVIYPYSSYVKTPAATENGYINVGTKGAVTQNGYDDMAHLAGANCPLYGVAEGVSDKTVPSLQMNQLTSVVRVKVTNNSGADVAVKSVAFTAEEAICGTFYVDVTGETPAYVASGANFVSNTASVSVSGDEKLADGETACVYVMFKPFTALAGSQLKLAVNGTEKVKDVETDLTFAPGVINTLSYSIESETKAVTIKEVLDGGKGATVFTGGLVVATYNRGFLIEDETGKILVYENKTPSAKIGDKVTVLGTTSLYAGLLQIGNPTVEVVSSNNAVVYPEPVVLDAAGMDAQLSASVISYIEYTGELVISGNYYNVNIDGANTAIGSISYPSVDLSALNGKTIRVTGYFIGVNQSKYVNTMAVSVEEVVVSQLDGKQIAFELWGEQAVLDLGVKTPGKLYVGLYDSELKGYYYSDWDVYDYMIVATDATSGEIRLAGEIPGGGSFGFNDGVNFIYTDYDGESLILSSEYYEVEDASASVLAEPVDLKTWEMPEYSVDGKQWVFRWTVSKDRYYDMVIDLGHTTEGIVYFAQASEDSNGNPVWNIVFACGYEILKTDSESGYIQTEAGVVFQYSELTETTMHVIEDEWFEFDEFAKDKTGTITEYVSAIGGLNL